MDTISKLSNYGKSIKSDIRFIGVPKTIDNDLVTTDHTPGFGSAAKYIGVVSKELIRDATVYNTNYVTVVEIMGRNAGWLTAAATLARSEDCEGVDMICLPETIFNLDNFINCVMKRQEQKSSLVIAVSEGIKIAEDKYVCELSEENVTVDAFGHKNLTGTARFLAGLLKRELNTKTRSIELSILQRCAAHISSRTDITEAFQVGGAAVKAAFEGYSGVVIILKRLSNDPYQCTTELCPVEEIANLEKKVPLEWILPNFEGMSEAYLSYARPLIQAELSPYFVNGLPNHIFLSKS